MKSEIKILFAALTLTLSLVSCEKWNDYAGDFDYTAVYFAYQNQLRTVIADDEMSFEFGPCLGGRRENKKNEWCTWRIAPELLEDEDIVGSKEFTLLPEDWYTLSSPERFDIRKGNLVGTSKIVFDREKFTSSPDALNNVYALPVQLLETSVDKILESKEYAVIVVKYINPYHGNYYMKGTRYILGEDDGYTVFSEYSNKDLVKNKVLSLKTASLHESTSTWCGGENSTDSRKLGLSLTVGADNSVTVAPAENASSILSFENASGTYNPGSRTFALVYEYTAEYTVDLGDGVTETRTGKFKVEEELIWRNTDMKFEQW